jgi:hypothetical protein
MAVGFRFMPNKTNSEKAVLVRQVWKDQAALPDSVVTRFVATDCPTTDRRMLQELHQEVFSGHPDAGKLDVGDDVWHVYHRIGKFVTYHCAWMKPSLLALLKRGVDVGSKPESMSIEHWQLVCAAKLEHELEKWVVEHDPNPRAAEQVEVCCKNLDNLFTHLPHVDKLALVGTTSNEHGNWVLNRRSKFVAHMRPDHTSDTVMYSLYLHNSGAAGKCGDIVQLPADIRSKAQALFPRGMDCAGVAGRGQAPFLLPFLPPQRVYGVAEYEAEFGACRVHRT